MQSQAVLIIAESVTLIIVPIPEDTRSLEATLVLILLQVPQSPHPRGIRSHERT